MLALQLYCSQSSLLNILATRSRPKPLGHPITDRPAFRNGIEPFERFPVIRVARETLRKHVNIRLEWPVQAWHFRASLTPDMTMVHPRVGGL
jgi:hypothetical protein